MILNDKFFNRDIEIKKCFENGAPLMMFDKETKSETIYSKEELLKIWQEWKE